MNEQDARRERHDFTLQRRTFLRDTDYIPPNPDILAPTFRDLVRATLRWSGIAFSCWAIISGGLYLGYVMTRTIIFGPDVW